MAENKTKENNTSVDTFLHTILDERKREDSYALIKMMQAITGEPAKMWGDAIIGFGSYHYEYATGRAGDSPIAAFSPRKQNLTVYIGGFENYTELLQHLGKYKISKVCLYLKRLVDVDADKLHALIAADVERTKALHI